MTVKTSISLTDEQEAFARALVEEGRYASLSAVMQRGLDLLRVNTEADDLEIAALRKLVAKRRKGAFVSSARMRKKLAALADRKRSAHGL